MNTNGPLWCGGGPIRHSSAAAGEAATAAVAASIVRRLMWLRLEYVWRFIVVPFGFLEP
jgi:hypothetical protein